MHLKLSVGYFEIICEVDPRSCVKRHTFYFCLDPDILPQFCPNLDFAILKIQRLKEKENFIKIWSSFKDHREIT